MDITYIPMARGFVLFLAVLLDWFSRRVLAWRLSITMEAALCVEALTMSDSPMFPVSKETVCMTAEPENALLASSASCRLNAPLLKTRPTAKRIDINGPCGAPAATALSSKATTGAARVFGIMSERRNY